MNAAWEALRSAAKAALVEHEHAGLRAALESLPPTPELGGVWKAHVKRSNGTWPRTIHQGVGLASDCGLFRLADSAPPHTINRNAEMLPSETAATCRLCTWSTKALSRGRPT